MSVKLPGTRRTTAMPVPTLNDIIEWDVQNWSVALRYWRQHSLLNPASTRALEIGSGHGGLSLWAALNGMEVLCTNLNEPSKEVRDKHQRYGVSNRISYKPLNALDIPHCEEFDVVLFKSVLGAVGALDNKENQGKAIREIYKSLKKGGELWFAENLMASPMHRFLRRKYVQWGKAWRYVTVQEMSEFLSPFSAVECTTLGFLGVLGRTSLQKSFLGRIDRVVDRLVPAAWHYIMIGVAAK
jgi:SAM-dependent methyltransferase